MGFSIKETEHFNSAQIVHGSTGATYNGSQYEYMNIPKAKFSFVIHFELSVSALKLIRQLYGTDVQLGKMTSYLVKDVQLPGFGLETVEVNQYNRTRLHQGKIHYDPVDLSIYDTVSSAAMQLMDAYRIFYYGDFSDKTLTSWKYDSISKSGNFQYTNPISKFIQSATNTTRDSNYTWGRSIYTQGDQDEGYFFKRLDIYEIDGNTYTVHNIHNPVIEKVHMDKKTHEDGEPATIQFTLRHEGISNICPVTNKKAIGSCTAEISRKLASTSNGEFSAMGFYKFWGDMDSAPLTSYDPNQIAGFPNQSGGLDFSTATGAINSVMKIGENVNSIISAIDGGGSFTDILENTKNAMGEGNIFSEGMGDLGGGIGAIKSIGGFF